MFRVRSHTHEGEFIDIEPTGSEIDVPAIITYRIEDGQIVEGWSIADVMGTMQQLGVIEPPGEYHPSGPGTRHRQRKQVECFRA